MKKLSKILILVLAVALICTGLVLAVSADAGTDNTASYTVNGEALTADLATAIENADAETTVKLEGDCTLTAQVKITKTITIDLNGYTLNLPNQNAFAVETAGIVFTITGNGTINADGTFIYSTATATVTVKGTGTGIDINHSGSVYATSVVDHNKGLIIYGTKAGTYNLENLDIVSNVYVNFREGSYASKPGDENNQRAAMFRTDEGTAGTRWNFTRVNFYRDADYDSQYNLVDAGAFVYIAGANAKATINECVIKNSGPLVNIAYMQANTDPDHVFAEINDSHMEVILRDGSRRVNALTPIYRTSERSIVGTMNLNNSWFGGNVYRVFYGTNAGLKVNANNTVLANTGANDMDGSNDTDVLIMRAGQLKMTNGSVISTGNGTLTMDVSQDGVVTQDASMKVEVGTRFNIKAHASRSEIEWIDADGNPVSKDNVKIVLDPIGNYQYPYLSTTDETVVSYNHLGADVIDMYAMEFGSGRGKGNIYGYMAEKDGNVDSQNDFSDAFQGAAKAGAFTDVTYGTNTSFKYWVSPNGGAEIGDQRTFTTDPYMIFGGQANATKAVAKIADTKVAVFEMDIATDSEYGFPAMGWQTNARDDSNTGKSEATFTTLNPDGSFTAGTLKGFNPNVKLSLVDWNHVTIVVYTDNTYNNCLGQTYVYVNGELLGYNNGAYGSAATYIQGIRFNVNKTSHTVGQSILVDNMIRRVYNSYAAGETDGAEKNPSAYLLTDLPKNTSPLNNNIQVHGLGYATIDDAKAAQDKYNSTSETTGIYENIELYGDIYIPQTVTTNVEVIHNGYTIAYTPAANGFVVDDEKYTFSDEYWYNAYWYNGKLGDLNDMMNDDNYIKTIAKVSHELDHANLFTEETPDYNLLKIVTQDGWAYDYAATEKITAFVPTLAELEAAKADASRAARFYPVITGVDMTYCVKNAAGVIYNGGINDVSATAALKELADNETFVLLDNVVLTEAGIAYASKTVNVDLNGNTLASSINGSMFEIGAYTTLNVYSSVAGGQLIAAVMNATGGVSTDNYAFTITNGTKTESGNYFFSNDDIYANLGQNRAEVAEAHVNVGKFGEIPGSNMCVIAETTFFGHVGGENCTMIADGANLISPTGSGTFANAYVYDGNITIKNCVLLAPYKDNVVNAYAFSKSSKNGDEYPRFTGFEDVVITSDILYENLIIINKVSGISDGSNNNIVGNNGDGFHVAVTFKNVVTTGRLNPANALRNSMDGFVAAETHSSTGNNPTAGTVTAICNIPMTWQSIDLGITESVLAFNIPVYNPETGEIENFASFNIANNGTSIEGLTNAYVLPVLTGATIYADDAAKVVWAGIGENDAAKIEYYVPGTAYRTITAPNVAPYHLNVTKLVHDGSWTGIPEAGTVLTADVNVIPGYTIESNVVGLKVNLSLYSDFLVNLYIPAELKPYIVSVNGVALGDKTVTLGEGENAAEYIKISKAVIAKNADALVAFEFAVAEGEFSGTQTVSVSIVDYASTILAGESYDEAEKILMYAALNYISNAMYYFDYSESSAVLDLLSQYSDLADKAVVDKSYANALENTGLGEYFTSASVVLGETPAFVLVPNGTFAGKVVVTYGNVVRTFVVPADSTAKIVVDGMKIYSFAGDVNVAVYNANDELVAEGKINLDTYAKYHTNNAENYNSETQEASEAALPLIQSLYDYVNVAKMFVEGTLVEAPAEPELPAEPEVDPAA